MRRISIFGATGSVGEQTVDLITRAGGPAAYHTVAVTGGQNIARLAQIAMALRAEVAVTADPARLDDLRHALSGSGIAAEAGPEAILAAAERPADWVMSAIVGAAGLAPGLTALQQGATLALANKESLVTAGKLLLATAKAHGAKILPVDSEHSAIFQALGQDCIADVARVVITASGGALRDWPMERLREASVAEASRHPNWAMGQRITVDSASMFNKAMEVIETREFFGFAPSQIEVVIHRQSVVHALVAFHDGAMMAHMGSADMRHPIGFALNYPERKALPVEPLDLIALGQISFEAPDLIRYPALRLCREAMEIRGRAGAVFNAGKEAALDFFLAGRIRFTDMASVVEDTLAALAKRNDLGEDPRDLADVLAMDAQARQIAAEMAVKYHK